MKKMGVRSLQTQITKICEFCEKEMKHISNVLTSLMGTVELVYKIPS